MPGWFVRDAQQADAIPFFTVMTGTGPSSPLMQKRTDFSAPISFPQTAFKYELRLPSPSAVGPVPLRTLCNFGNSERPEIKMVGGPFGALIRTWLSHERKAATNGPLFRSTPRTRVKSIIERIDRRPTKDPWGRLECRSSQMPTSR
jgi:hypothetical protein